MFDTDEFPVLGGVVCFTSRFSSSTVRLFLPMLRSNFTQ